MLSFEEYLTEKFLCILENVKGYQAVSRKSVSDSTEFDRAKSSVVFLIGSVLAVSIVLHLKFSINVIYSFAYAILIVLFLFGTIVKEDVPKFFEYTKILESFNTLDEQDALEAKKIKAQLEYLRELKDLQLQVRFYFINETTPSKPKLYDLDSFLESSDLSRIEKEFLKNFVKRRIYSLDDIRRMIDRHFKLLTDSSEFIQTLKVD